jgi:DNA (cytosine-5)-methyltransferase 1
MTANRGLAYKVILEDFANLGLRWDEVKRCLNKGVRDFKVPSYHLIFKDIVNAAHFGVPQNRKRLILVGVRSDLVAERNLLELSSVFRGVVEEKQTVFKRFPLTCVEALEGRPLPDLQDVYREVMKEYDGVWFAVNSKKAWKWKSDVWDRLTFNIVKDYLMLNSLKEEGVELAFKEHEKVLRELGYYGVNVSDLKLPDESCSPPPESREVKEKMRMIPPGENFAFTVGTKWELRKRGVSQIYRRIHPLKPSYTIVGYGGGGMAMYHYARSRSALSSREKARLQTFPDSFMFVGSYSDMKAEIGEAVPPMLAKRLAEALAVVLRTLE